MDVEKEIILLLRQKKYYVNKMLIMTRKALIKSGDMEKDAENFVGLIEAREETLGKLEALESETKELSKNLSNSPSNAYTTKVRSYNREINEMSRELVDIEQNFLENIPDIVSYFQEKIRVANNHKRMKNTYDGQNNIGGSFYFDRNN